MEYKAIIFDYGGVLCTPGKIDSFCKSYALELNKDPEEFMKLAEENRSKAQVNEIDSKVFWEKCAEFLAVDSETFRSKLIDSFNFKLEVLEFAKKLKDNYKLALVSNHLEDWFKEINEKHNLGEIFDVIVTSYDFKVAKPNIEIFKEVVQQLDVEPKECIYIDDLEENVSPAKELGMKMILFKNLNQLKEELNK
ncbi:HAD family phosphatase [Candidatus Pacearchaeota archaeon]|nr:HAD family phosphatase [Candidatus Pacearchaeota archaeon]